ncbi:MAG TPA: MEDS domain-containing protein, partial [Pyrinomonadaceae bacterium]|nr:MEDS domain-containing protein [Pyrinomonadaceae bacterium]
EDESHIVMAVAESLIYGLKSGDTCIVAATRNHLKQIDSIVRTFIDGLDAATADGQYVPLEAAETLSTFMVDGMPDAARFSSSIGATVERAAKRPGRIRIFGELVCVLCSEGNVPAALALEDLWNGLQKKYPFSLFCAYSMSAMDSAVPSQMASVCAGHTNVIPAESYTLLRKSSERLRKIAVLQQKSRQLEAEVARLQQHISDPTRSFAT